MDDQVDGGGSGYFELFVTVFFLLLMVVGGVYGLVSYFREPGVVSVVEPVHEASFSVSEMVATLKGSIYSNGEAISVFGTCMDTYDSPIVNASAWFSAWYPNGTQFISGVNMTQLSPGYFLYTSTMSVVQGTYLTEVVCNATIGGLPQFAKAWGEWQNPFWANVVVNFSNMTFNVNWTNITNILTNMSANISYLYQNVTYNFNQTNYIANASVDRNTSLLATLLYYLVNWSSYAAPFCGNLTVSEYSVDEVSYFTDWNIKAKVYQGTTLMSDPDVACMINTTQNVTQQYMDVEGDHFTFTEWVSMSPQLDFNWTINCSCVT